MINFFRKIRRKFADNNQFLKYSRYAVGEILLVVVGILIALSINNWNEKRKESQLQDKLRKNLYSELLDVQDSNKSISKSLDSQIQLLELILSQGSELNIELLINQTKNNWAVKEFSLGLYILSFTHFYNQNNKFYKSAVNDGSISILVDKDFVHDLEYIYINGSANVERLYSREVVLNQEIQHYLSLKYPEIFINNTTENGSMTLSTIRKLLDKIKLDGTYRLKIQEKLFILKAKKFIIDNRMGQVIERIIKSDNK